MDTQIEYLRSYLEEEFASYPQVRVRVLQPAGTQRSPDLVQDYDADNNDLHRRRGVDVRIGSREFFFPVEWVSHGRFSEVARLASEVRAYLD